MLVHDAGDDRMSNYDAIMNNITTHMQYYTLERFDLVQLYLSQAHEYRVAELIIIKNKNLNIDHILLSIIKKEV